MAESCFLGRSVPGALAIGLRALLGGALVSSLALLATSSASAQVTQERLNAIGANLNAAQSFYNKLSPEQRKMFSGGASNFFHVVKNWRTLERRALAIQKTLPAGRLHNVRTAFAASKGSIPNTGALVQVSDSDTDFEFGPSGGFTHSETSTSWCGNNVVVGFNDSGSVFESLIASSGADLSFNGFAQSTNAGKAYTDQGFLPSAGTGNPFNFLEGDPVLACAGASTFYYSSLLFTAPTVGDPQSAISVSKSTDGGATFGAPAIAVEKDAFFHSLDKDWMAVNPANAMQIAVTYTDFDLSPTNGCSGFERIAIEMVGSADGGATWSSPALIDQVCESAIDPFTFLQGSQVAFSPSGAVNVAFESYALGIAFGGRKILFTQAPFLGGSFATLVKVARVLGVGDSFELQGGFRAFIDLQGMAIDRSGTATNGNIYIVWHDTDLVDSAQLFNGVAYAYSDVWISRSSDNGATWSSPAQVDTNREPLANGLGTDSFMPGVAVDNTSGEVAVCWYDRREDPFNYDVGRFCGDSFDAGETFTNTRITPASFPPIHGTDDFVNPQYMGDYDTVATDGLKATSGFTGAFQFISSVGVAGHPLVPAPDVVSSNFK